MSYHDDNLNIMAHLMAKAMSMGIAVEIVTSRNELLTGRITHLERYAEEGDRRLRHKIDGSWISLRDITGISKYEPKGPAGMLTNEKIFPPLAKALKEENGAKTILALGDVVRGAYMQGVADGSRAGVKPRIRTRRVTKTQSKPKRVRRTGQPSRQSQIFALLGKQPLGVSAQEIAKRLGISTNHVYAVVGKTPTLKSARGVVTFA